MMSTMRPTTNRLGIAPGVRVLTGTGAFRRQATVLLAS
jgi:hypothetical protein